MSLARDVTTVGGATLTSRLLGFLRDAGVAAVLGAGALSDAYFAALQIPYLFRRLLAEGALNSAFVPMWLRIKDENGAAATRQFGEEVLSAMAAWLIGLALIGVIFAPAIVHLLAPGFRDQGERFPLAVEFGKELQECSQYYVLLAGDFLTQVPQNSGKLSPADSDKAVKGMVFMTKSEQIDVIVKRLSSLTGMTDEALKARARDLDRALLGAPV